MEVLTNFFAIIEPPIFKIKMNVQYDLQLACMYGHSKSVKFILKNLRGADIAAKDNYCIELACQSRSFGAAKYILENHREEVYLRPSLIRRFRYENKKFLMTVMGPKIFYVEEGFHIINVQGYKEFFNSSRDINEDKHHKLFDDGNILVYSKNKKYGEALEKYKITLSPLVKK